MLRHKILGELVTFKNAEQFHHDGILYQRESNRTTIVHVHGSFGNFYQNEFLRIMAGVLLANGINFLCFNVAAHDGLVEAYRHEWDFEYAGGAISNFDKCVVDIQAAVDFVKPFSPRIILQGHSIGCDRVLQYLIETKAPYDLVLLSPCDSYQLQLNWIRPETVEDQIVRLKRGLPNADYLDWLPEREYGIRQGDWRYPIPITRNALLAIMEGPPFRLMRISDPAIFRIDAKALVYIGGDDALQTSEPTVIIKYLRERIRQVTTTSFFPDGDHSLWGCEREVAEDIAKWAISG
jgi:hypothetical protein